MFDTNDTNLEYQVDRLDDQLSDPDSTLPVELKAAVLDVLNQEDDQGRTVDGRAERVRGEDAHIQVAIRYISNEVENLDEREKPACTCDDRWCKPKQGKLPKTVRDAPSLAEGVRKWNQEHPGTPHVLFEARDEFYDERAELKAIYRKCRIALRNRVHPAKLDEWGELTAEDFVDGEPTNGATGD